MGDEAFLAKLRSDFATMEGFDEEQVAKRVRQTKAEYLEMFLPINVNFVTVAGDQYPLEVNRHECISDLKGRIAAQLRGSTPVVNGAQGLYYGNLELLVNGNTADDVATVHRLAIKDGDDITVVVKDLRVIHEVQKAHASRTANAGRDQCPHCGRTFWNNYERHVAICVKVFGGRAGRQPQGSNCGRGPRLGLHSRP